MSLPGRCRGGGSAKSRFAEWGLLHPSNGWKTKKFLSMRSSSDLWRQGWSYGVAKLQRRYGQR
ncbi:hypothetical protein [Corallococcus caeni]|uniref:hypothetical protein n=1 Tax=Corallococcus caeni TaxID=3082388 RepID=UPI0030C6A56B